MPAVIEASEWVFLVCIMDLRLPGSVRRAECGRDGGSFECLVERPERRACERSSFYLTRLS